MTQTLAIELRDAVRQIRRNAATSLLIVAILSAALGSAMGLAAPLEALVLRPAPVAGARRLVVVEMRDRGGEVLRYIPSEAMRRFGATQQVFDGFFGYSGGGVFVAEGPDRLADGIISAASPNAFDVLGLRPLLGRGLTIDDGPDQGAPASVVVLSYVMWQRLFHGDVNVVGQTIKVDGVPLTVVGVLPADQIGLETDASADLWVPLSLLRKLTGVTTPVRARDLVGHLRPGVTLEQARSVISAMWPATIADLPPVSMAATSVEDAKAQRVTVESLSTGFSSLRTRYGDPLQQLAALSALMLLIAAVNVGGLLVVRIANRERALAIHLALGATRRQLIRPLVLEGVLLSLAGAALAVPVGWMMANVFRAGINEGRMFPAPAMTPDLGLLAVLAATALVIGSAIAWLPAHFASRRDPRETLLRARGSGSAPRRWASALVVMQVALTSVLVFGAALFGTSLHRLRTLDLGFTPPNLVFGRAWQLPGPKRTYDERSYYPALVDRIAAIPGVQSVALTQIFPGAFNAGALQLTPLRRDAGSADAGKVDVLVESISPGFFRTAGTPLLSGRDFTWADGVDSPGGVILTESAATTLFPDGRAVGARVRLGDTDSAQTLEVIAIASDVTVGNLRTRRVPVAFRARMQQASMRVPVIVARVDPDASRVGADIADAVKAMGQEYMRGVLTIEQQLDATLLRERLLMQVSAMFGMLALVLAGLGLFGLQADRVIRRRGEIGVRLAIGASRGRIVRGVVVDALRLAIVGLAIGLPAALAAGRVLQSQLFGTSGGSVGILSLAALGILSVMVLASLLPAHRASKVSPMDALRAD